MTHGLLSTFRRRLLAGALAAALVAGASSATCSAQATAAPPSPGQAPTNDVLAAHLEEYMRAQVAANTFSGAVLVARGGMVVFRGAYGEANVAAHQANTPETRFRIGSITKPFTAMGIMLLQERGKLAVTDGMCKYVEPCPAAWQPITIRHLLSHTSGLPNITALPSYELTMAQPSTPRQTMDRVKDMPLEFAPGEQFKYSNTGYVVLGAIIERVTGEPYASWIKTSVLAPLGMNDTAYENMDGPTPGLAVGYALPRPGDPSSLSPAPPIHMSVPHAAGALVSTVGDLLKLDRAVAGRKLLSKASWDAMLTPVKGNYAYGWIVQTQPAGRTVINHDGGINGFSSSFSHIVESDTAIIVLRNQDNALALGRDLIAMATGGRYDLPRKRAIAKVDPSIYDAYVGEYELAPGFVLTVTRAGDRLLTQATGQQQVEVFPESETEFFLTVVDAQLTFVKGPDGKVTQLVLHQNGRDLPAKRVK